MISGLVATTRAGLQKPSIVFSRTLRGYFARLLCTKHIQDNVIGHSKNKLPTTKDECNDVIEDIFGVDGLVSANDTVDFNMKSDNLCNTHPVFSDYYNKYLKNRLQQHVNRPSRNNSRLRLWTNNNCESMNHRFKLATDWKPQHLPELINTIHCIVFHEHFKRHYMQYYLYSSKTSDEKGQLFNRLLADRHLSVHKVISADGTLVIPAVGKLAKNLARSTARKLLLPKPSRDFRH